MPVRKFRSVEEMTPLPDRRPFDPENLRLAIAWSHAALALHPAKRTPGVHKYRSYEDMKARGQPAIERAGRQRTTTVR
jgi:hypothetical protein